MHAIRNSRSMKTFATALVVATFGLGSAGHAQSPAPVVLTSEANSDAGTATQTYVGLLPAPPQPWGPDDQSETNTSGSNDEPTPSITESINGVTTYQSEDDDNSTDAGGVDDQANASSSSGSGSALGGLITWSNYSVQETCLPDSNTPDEIDCTTYVTISDLLINGQPAATSGSFAPGTSIPVSGNIPDTNCPLGTDSFSGNLVLDNSILNSGTEQGSDTEIAMQITGTATCYTLGLVPLYTTTYNEQIGGPEIAYKSVGYPKYISQSWQDDFVYGKQL